MEINNPNAARSQGWCRSELAPADGKETLGIQEREVWNQLESLFAPLVLGDKAGDAGIEELPSPLSLGWCALYPLAIYFMRGVAAGIPVHKEPHAPDAESWISWKRLVETFWERRSRQLAAFRAFLTDWELSETLRTPRDMTSPTHATPWSSDRKVLGIHRFSTWDEVVDYVLCWRTNPDIRDTRLWQHRITVSRIIDLICSELVANGFEHSGQQSAEVFIMAKLCSAQSAWRALEHNKQHPYLTATELKYFGLAVSHDCPILQLCIGDTGQGFGGNEALTKEYTTAHPGNGTPDEADLIVFALSGKVTTKTHKDRRSFWKSQMDDAESPIPAIHGLSEILRCVVQEHGYWRIHSRTVAMDYDFLNIRAIDEKQPLLPGKRAAARLVNGCLHYFMFPLLPDEHRPTPRIADSRFRNEPFTLIDAADDALSSNLGEVQAVKPEEWVGALCKRIVAARQGQSGRLLVHLAMLDQLGREDLEDACLDLVHCLHMVRNELAVFFSGVSERTRYQLCRYNACPNFNLEYRVLPFLDFDAPADSGLAIRLGYSDKVRDVETQLVEVLTGNTTGQILKSDSKLIWEMCRKVCEQNLGLFQIKPVSEDEALCARFHLPSNDPDTLRLAFGGCSFSELAALLQKHQAIARYSEEGYFRLGQMLPTYAHLGRLWADPEFRFKVTNWLRIALHRAQRSGERLAEDGRGLALLAVLHPATELAHELVQNTPFSNTEIVEIRRVSDLRWDYEPLLKLRSRHVAILIDMVLTGRTVRSIVDIIRYLDLNPWACFSVLSIKGQDLNIPEFPFCVCTEEDLRSAAPRKDGVESRKP